jgi:hypothetical protein
MRPALIVSFLLCWIAGLAVAQTGSPFAPKPPDGVARPAKNPKKSKAGDASEKAPEKPAGQDALGTCLEMWEPATHMSKTEWARACRRVAERLNDLTVK